MTGEDKTCLLRGPGHYLEECKVLKEYSKKYAAQRPHKNSKSRSIVKTNCNNTVKLDISVK